MILESHCSGYPPAQYETRKMGVRKGAGRTPRTLAHTHFSVFPAAWLSSSPGDIYD